MQRHQRELEQLGVEVFIVTFDESAEARDYVERNRPPWPVLVDRERELYQALGYGRTSWWSLVRPRSIIKYLRLWAQGAPPQAKGSDLQQLGGDALVSPRGILKFNHASTEPHDRPRIEDLLDVVANSPPER